VVERSPFDVQHPRCLRLAPARLKVRPEAGKEGHLLLGVVLEERPELGLDETGQVGTIGEAEQELMDSEVVEVERGVGAVRVEAEAGRLTRFVEAATERLRPDLAAGSNHNLHVGLSLDLVRDPLAKLVDERPGLDANREPENRDRPLALEGRQRRDSRLGERRAALS